MVNMCDALSGTSTATLQRQKSLFHTSFHSNISNNSMGKHTHLDTNEHLLNIFQMWANTRAQAHGWAYKHHKFLHLNMDLCTFVCHPHSNVEGIRKKGLIDIKKE